jgi:hypothetical protein
VHRGTLEQLSRDELATAHLKVAACAEHTLHLQRRCILRECERLQEEDAAQCRALGSWSSGAACHVRHLEVAGAWEDDNALHDMLINERAQRSEQGRAEGRNDI